MIWNIDVRKVHVDHLPLACPLGVAQRDHGREGTHERRDLIRHGDGRQQRWAALLA